LWLNDTVVTLVAGVAVLRETDPQTTLWDALLPEEAKRLPTELIAVDGYLDDERFIAPRRTLFDQRLGRPSVPVDTLLRLLYLKHRYGLGYETLCRRSPTRSRGGVTAATLLPRTWRTPVPAPA
jgi:hypothetical protein